MCTRVTPVTGQRRQETDFVRDCYASEQSDGGSLMPQSDQDPYDRFDKFLASLLLPGPRVCQFSCGEVSQE